jgi:aldose 1-epimerase
MQFYAGQYLDSVASPAGQPYSACAGLALEPGYLPDSPNHPEWPQPSCWVMPGETWHHVTRYAFRAA